MKYLLLITTLLLSLQKGKAQEDSVKLLADTYMDSGAYDKALKLWDKILEEDKSDAIVHYNRGVCHFVLYDNKAALADLNNCLAIDSSLYLAYCLRLAILEEEGLYREAIADGKKALDVISDEQRDTLKGSFSEANVKCMVGNCYWKFRNFDSALLYLNDVYASDSNHSYAIHDLIIVMIELKRFDDAKYYLDRYDIIAGENDNPQYHYVWYYVNTGDYKKAIEIAKEVMRTNKKPSARMYSNMAFAYHKLGNRKKALKYIELAIEEEPDNSYAYKNRAIIHIAHGDMVDACNDLRTAQDLGYTSMWGDEVKELLLDHCNKM